MIDTGIGYHLTIKPIKSKWHVKISYEIGKKGTDDYVFRMDYYSEQQIREMMRDLAETEVKIRSMFP